ncbi:MAG: diacylglycerol kinase family lipid kinase [Planctomycetes bacterium]|nr:diacylglycerol kinase family lipid kinase [Planctomycetota bacterium]
MRVCVVVNPAAGNADALDRLAARRPVTVWRAPDARATATLAARAAREGFDRVVAAGGDGTLARVVEGLGALRDRVVVGLVPLGTGNDFARTVGLPPDPLDALDLVLRGGAERRLDLIEVAVAGAGRRLCVNAAQGGFSGQVDEGLDGATKAAWGPLAYVRAAVATLPALTAYEVDLVLDGAPRERVEAINVVVANGRTVGGGVRVAPEADPADGLLDVVVVRAGTALGLAGVGARLVAGNVLESDLVLHRRARRVALRARPPMPFNADGDLLPAGDLDLSVLPGALRMVCGEM